MGEEHGYDAFIADAAKHCRCCPCCGDVPCPGVLAGGMCDEFGCRYDGPLEEETCDEEYEHYHDGPERAD